MSKLLRYVFSSVEHLCQRIMFPLEAYTLSPDAQLMQTSTRTAFATRCVVETMRAGRRSLATKADLDAATNPRT